MAVDKFATYGPNADGPYVRSVALDVSSTDQTLTDVSDAFLCTTAGNLICTLRDNGAAVTLAVLAGVVYRVRVIAVTKTSTTAVGHFLYAK